MKQENKKTKMRQNRDPVKLTELNDTHSEQQGDLTNPPCSISHHFFHHSSTLWQDSMVIDWLFKSLSMLFLNAECSAVIQRHKLGIVEFYFNVKMPSSKENAHIYYLIIAFN